MLFTTEISVDLFQNNKLRIFSNKMQRTFSLAISKLRTNKSSSLATSILKKQNNFSKLRIENVWDQNNKNQKRKFSTNEVAKNNQTMEYLRDAKRDLEVYLIGTAHISEKSAQEVANVIEKVKPTVVFIELDEARARALRSNTTQNYADNLFTAFKKQQPFGQSLVETFMKSIYSVAKMSGLVPGKEFLVAMQEAEKNKSRIVYGDRSSEETLRRIYENLNMQEILSLMMMKTPSLPPSLQHLDSKLRNMPLKDFLVELVEAMKDRETIRQSMALMPKSVRSPLVEERDEIMSRGLLNLKNERCVAVVGMAHMDGIIARWNKVAT